MATGTVNTDALKKRIYDGLKQGRFGSPDDLVDVSDGDEGNVHVVVVSRKFDDMRYQEKEDLLWQELSNHV
ncbi:MAG TPA: hypothetical protein VF170_18480, partial [Planctomycetaceae bacterium]